MKYDKVIVLNRNEYFFSHPSEVLKTLSLQQEENYLSSYAKPSQLEDLRTQIASLYQVEANGIFLGHGAEDIFVKILSWYRKEKSDIVIEDFSWTNYLHIAEGFDYRVHTVPVLQEENSFEFNYKAFEAKLSQLKSAIIFITSPNNPTGHEIDLKEFYNLMLKFPQHLFILDSVYSSLSHKNFPLLFSAQNLHNFIFVGSFSKFFGMPGLRLGYAVGKLPLAFHLNLGLQPSAISIAFAALKNFKDYEKNREYMLHFSSSLLNKNFKHIKIYKTSAPFFLAKVTNKDINFEEVEIKSGVVPKYIFKEHEVYIRFGLGPQFICERVEAYLNYINIPR